MRQSESTTSNPVIEGVGFNYLNFGTDGASHHNHPEAHSSSALGSELKSPLIEPTFDQLNPRYLLSVSILYIICAANEYWLVNWFKQYNVDLPIYFAMLQNSSWPLQLWIYRNECNELPEPRVITKEMYKSYLFLGLLALYIGLSRMFSYTMLPPVLAVITANTEIVWETVMTIIVLKKKVSNLQYGAVVLVIAGVVLALYDPRDGTLGDGNGHTKSSTILIGCALSFSSRFASSLNTILAEKFLGKGAKSKIGVKEAALANAVVPFFLLPFVLVGFGEYRFWPRELYDRGTWPATVIFLLSISIMEAKHFDRFSKYAVVENTSTLFFAGVDSVMKMVAGVGAFVFFPSYTRGEVIWPSILGFALICGAVTLMYFDKRAKSKAAKEEARRLAQLTGAPVVVGYVPPVAGFKTIKDIEKDSQHRGSIVGVDMPVVNSKDNSMPPTLSPSK